MNFLKEYWDYRKEGGELSIRAYANRKRELGSGR
jgi:undecaprenyl pyrophosphate synthase